MSRFRPGIDGGTKLNLGGLRTKFSDIGGHTMEKIWEGRRHAKTLVTGFTSM